MRRADLPPLWPAGFAAAGAVAGHAIGFALAIPDARARAAALRATGHAEFGHIVVAALLMSACSAAVIGLRHYRAARAEARATPASHGPGRPRGAWLEHTATLVTALSVVQAGAFTGCEMIERASVGEPIRNLFHEHAFLFGLAMQPLVAFLVASLVRALARVADFAGRATAERTIGLRESRPIVDALPNQRDHVAAVFVHGSASVRGPPDLFPSISF